MMPVTTGGQCHLISIHFKQTRTKNDYGNDQENGHYTTGRCFTPISVKTLRFASLASSKFVYIPGVIVLDAVELQVVLDIA